MPPLRWTPERLAARVRRRLTSAVARSSTTRLGPAARPVAVSEDLNDPTLPKASGGGRASITHPLDWSPDRLRVSDAIDLAREYEQVLREGTERRPLHVDADERHARQVRRSPSGRVRATALELARQQEIERDSRAQSGLEL